MENQFENYDNCLKVDVSSRSNENSKYFKGMDLGSIIKSKKTDGNDENDNLKSYKMDVSFVKNNKLNENGNMKSFKGLDVKFRKTEEIKLIENNNTNSYKEMDANIVKNKKTEVKNKKIGEINLIENGNTKSFKAMDASVVKNKKLDENNSLRSSKMYVKNKKIDEIRVIEDDDLNFLQGIDLKKDELFNNENDYVNYLIDGKGLMHDNKVNTNLRSRVSLKLNEEGDRMFLPSYAYLRKCDENRENKFNSHKKEMFTSEKENNEKKYESCKEEIFVVKNEKRYNTKLDFQNEEMKDCEVKNNIDYLCHKEEMFDVKNKSKYNTLFDNQKDEIYNFSHEVRNNIQFDSQKEKKYNETMLDCRKEEILAVKKNISVMDDKTSYCEEDVNDYKKEYNGTYFSFDKNLKYNKKNKNFQNEEMYALDKKINSFKEEIFDLDKDIDFSENKLSLAQNTHYNEDKFDKENYYVYNEDKFDFENTTKFNENKFGKENSYIYNNSKFGFDKNTKLHENKFIYNESKFLADKNYLYNENKPDTENNFASNERKKSNFVYKNIQEEYKPTRNKNIKKILYDKYLLTSNSYSDSVPENSSTVSESEIFSEKLMNQRDSDLFLFFIKDLHKKATIKKDLKQIKSNSVPNSIVDIPMYYKYKRGDLKENFQLVSENSGYGSDGNEQYVCIYCNMKYIYRRCLVNHIKKKHRRYI